MTRSGSTLSVRPSRRAIGLTFVANGLGAPSFLARIPERQSALDMSDATLGLVLAGLAFGALLASGVAGRAVGAFGSRRVLLASGGTLAAVLWLAGVAPSPATLFAALVVLGAADAAMDISMNANGAGLERQAGRSLLHGLHAAWSVGALAAAGLAAAAAGVGLPLTVHLLLAGSAIAAFVGWSRPGLVRNDHQGPMGVAAHGAGAPVETADGVAVPVEAATEGGSPPVEAAAISGSVVPGSGAHGSPPGLGRWWRGWADRRRRASGADSGRRRVAGSLLDAGRRWRGPLAVLATAVIGGAIIEGAPADWGAVQLERFGAATGASSLAFAAFAAGMVGGRLVGDRLTDRFGPAVVLRGGMGMAAVGIAGGVLLAQPVVFALGLVLTGFGASGLFPLAFSAAGRTPGVPPGAGAATVSLAARVGFLVEPLLVGAVANVIGLRAALGLVAAVAVTLALAARRITR